MADFNVRSDSVDVQQIMEQIRARIREKRGVDYTEQQIRELAGVKLEKLLDPRGVRSDLLTRFKEKQPEYVPPLLPLYKFEDTTIYETHRGPLRWIRRMLNPILKLFFNPNVIIHALHSQADINALNLEREAAEEKRRIEMETLYYELVHNLVFELTRLGIETKNLKLRVESLASRLEFNERRARALESVVVYKPSNEAEAQAPLPESPLSGAQPQGGQAATVAGPRAFPTGSSTPAEGPGQRSRRRRRRRGRRSGLPASAIMGGTPGATAPGASAAGPSQTSAERPGAEQPGPIQPGPIQPGANPPGANQAAANQAGTNLGAAGRSEQAPAATEVTTEPRTGTDSAQPPEPRGTNGALPPAARRDTDQ
jgi:hypothetical protein